MAVFEQAINDIKVLTRRARANPSLWDNPLFRNEVNGLRNWIRDQSMEPAQAVTPGGWPERTNSPSRT